MLPSEGGNLGPVNVDLGFRPPDGVGLAVDAAVLVGGGYLSFNPKTSNTPAFYNSRSKAVSRSRPSGY